MTSDRFRLNKNADNRHCEYTVLSPSQKRILNIFFATTVIGTFLALLGITLYYIYAFAAQANGSHAFDWLLGIFSDFVAIMDISLSDSPYLVGGASYPPMAIALLYPFALMCKSVLLQYDSRVLHIDVLTSKVIAHPQFWVAFVLFFLLCTALILFAVLKKYRLDPISSLKLAVIIILCTPFVYAVMRGNVIYFAFIFLLIFLLWKDHPNAVLREIAYLFLALAGIIKIYPLFFGVFLLHKKKWFATIRIALYFAIGTFFSFFLFQDGLGNLSPFLSHLGDFMNAGDRLLSGVNLSLSSALCKLLDLFLPIGAAFSVFRYVNLALLIAVFLMATVTATFTKSDFSRALIAAAIVVLIPSISYFYVLIFTLIPFFEFIKSYDSYSRKKQLFYTVCFLFLFFTPTILLKNFIIHALVVMVMLVTESYEVTRKELLPILKKKKS